MKESAAKRVSDADSRPDTIVALPHGRASDTFCSALEEWEKNSDYLWFMESPKRD
jgi:hypothetical protein